MSKDFTSRLTWEGRIWFSTTWADYEVYISECRQSLRWCFVFSTPPLSLSWVLNLPSLTGLYQQVVLGLDLPGTCSYWWMCSFWWRCQATFHCSLPRTMHRFLTSSRKKCEMNDSDEMLSFLRKLPQSSSLNEHLLSCEMSSASIHHLKF